MIVGHARLSSVTCGSLSVGNYELAFTLQRDFFMVLPSASMNSKRGIEARFADGMGISRALLEQHAGD